jgi:hypothetical protein
MEMEVYVFIYDLFNDTISSIYGYGVHKLIKFN